MRYKIIFSTLLVATSAFLWTGCVKTGPQGPQGTAGYDGLDGNSVVTASPWYTPTAWSGQANDWFFDVTSSSITKDMVEGGTILAYGSFPGDLYDGKAVRPLPAFAIGCNWDFLLPNDGNSSYGTIEFTSDMTARPGTNGYNFRFILIPATYYLKSSKLKSAADLKSMPYADVCKFLGIKE